MRAAVRSWKEGIFAYQLRLCKCDFKATDPPIYGADDFAALQMGCKGKQAVQKLRRCSITPKTKGMLEEKNRGQVAKIIRELFEENCLLPVLQQFADLVPEVWEILDKTFVVYEGEPEKQLVLNYRRVEGELAEAQYHEMELPCVCDGIYAAGFILFPESGSIISQCPKGRRKFLENGMLLAQEEAAEAMQGRYAWLYEMAQAQLLQEDLSAQKERTQNYLYTAFCAKRLFGMLK